MPSIKKIMFKTYLEKPSEKQIQMEVQKYFLAKILNT